MGAVRKKKDPALTYNFDDFVEIGRSDELTYNHFSILRMVNPVTFSDQCVVDYYLPELKNACSKVEEFTEEEIVRYKYRPDLLAWDVYGSTQLDFIVLLCNGIIDPKEFDFKKKYLMLPKKTDLTQILSKVYNAEGDWIRLNRNELEDGTTNNHVY